MMSCELGAIQSQIDARADMSDAQFLLAFNLFCYSGDSQPPGSTLFKK